MNFHAPETPEMQRKKAGKIQKLKKINLYLLVVVVSTLLSIFIYPYIPSHSYSILNSDEWRSELFYTNTSDDLRINNWIDERDFHFRCEIEEDSERYQQCGVNLYFGGANDFSFVNGADFSGFTHLKIKASFKGIAPQVRIFFRNYNPAYSSPDDANSAKFMSLLLTTNEFEGGGLISIGLDEFIVADWWRVQRELPREHLPLSFSNITTTGFDFSDYMGEAKELEFHLQELYFEGPWIAEEHWYLGILVFWMVAILLTVGYQFFSLWRSSLTYTKVITELVTDKASLELETQELEKLSNQDRLTGALNRLGVEKSIESMVAGQQSSNIGLILIDVDHFKRVNDHRGHDVGDIVLKDIVDIVKANIREHDVFGRWGGEEFILIVPNADINSAFFLAEKIREIIADKTFLEENPLKVTASFGVASILKDEDFDDAFKRVDKALYKAKEQGRNCTIIA